MLKSLPLTAAVTVHDVAAYLKENGVTIISVKDDEQDVVDAEIVINEIMSVQVGSGYALVNVVKDDNTFWMGKQHYDAKDILDDIQKRMRPTLRLVQ